MLAVAERRTTDGELGVGEDVLDLLPDQDCRSPRPISKRSSSLACVPVNVGTERWTDSLLASMKTIGSFRRRSRADEGTSDLIRADRTSTADASCPADASASDLTPVTEEGSGPARTIQTWPLFNDRTSVGPNADPISEQARDATACSATDASSKEQCSEKASAAETKTVPAQRQVTPAEDDKFAVLAQLLASKELAAYIGGEPGAVVEMHSGANALGSGGAADSATASLGNVAGLPNGPSAAHIFYNGRGSAVPAAGPAGVIGQSAPKQVAALATSGGGPYEYTVATGTPRRQWFRGGSTPEEAGRAMYARAMAARERAARRNEAVRAQRQAAEEAQCSFSPKINRARNDALLLGQASWPVPDEPPQPAAVSSGKSKPPRTPRLAAQDGSSSLQLSGNPFASLSLHVSQDSPSTSSTHLNISRQLLNAQAIKNASSKSKKGAVEDVPGEEQEPKEDASIKAGERLYNEALQSLERQRTAAQLSIQEELEQMRAAAPRARSLPPAVYGAGAATRVRLIRARSISPRRRNPAYQEWMKECTFKPKTLWRTRTAASGRRSRSLNRQGDPPASRRRPQRASISADEALDRFLRRASLTADQVPRLLHLTGEDQDRQHGAESANEPDQATAIADSLERLALGGDASTDDKRHGWMTHAKSGKGVEEELPREEKGHVGELAPDLDFEEFLQRQKIFVKEHSRKVELTRTLTAKRLSKTIGISPGSRFLLRQWKTVKARPALAVERKSSIHKTGKENGVRPPMHSWSLDETFKPKISRRAQRRKARSVEELHEGGRLQRQQTLERLRLERTAAEEAQLTFAPSINPCFSITSRPLLDLTNPGPYLAHAEAQRRRLEAVRQQAAEERKERELADCTFSPRTIPLPAFMQRLAGTHGSVLHSKSDLESYALQLKWL